MPHDVAREYGFTERMAMSNGVAATASVAAILLREIPGAVAVTRASANDDRSGTDYWVGRRNGAALSVDTKVREHDWAATHADEDDLALETFSVIERNVIGWSRNPIKRTDYILWLWKDTGRWCLVPFPMLAAVTEQHWAEWRQIYRSARQRTVRTGTTEYHSECVFVPRLTVWRAIYRRFGGRLVA